MLTECLSVNATDIRGHTPLHQVTLGMGNYDYKISGMDKWGIKYHPGRVIRLAQRLLESGTDVNGGLRQVIALAVDKAPRALRVSPCCFL